MAKLVNIFVIFGAVLVSCAAFPFESGRIVGGAAAAVDQFPYQVSIRTFGSHICGGSIIADKWILTAGHCVKFPSKLLTVVVGSIYLNKNGVTYSIKRAIKHDKYVGGRNDIALIELAEPLKFTKSISAIKLSHSEVPAGGKIIISGWGSAYIKGPVSNTLKYNNEITKLDSKSCTSIENYYEGLMCLKHSVGNGACSGDSGGPATYDNVLVGVASFVVTACATNEPDGYVDVHHYVDWINSKTGLNL